MRCSFFQCLRKSCILSILYSDISDFFFFKHLLSVVFFIFICVCVCGMEGRWGGGVLYDMYMLYNDTSVNGFQPPLFYKNSELVILMILKIRIDRPPLSGTFLKSQVIQSFSNNSMSTVFVIFLYVMKLSFI